NKPTPQPEKPVAPIAPQQVHPEVGSNIVSLTPKADQKTQASATSPKVMTYSTGTKKQEIFEDNGQFANAAAPKGSYASIDGHGSKNQGSVSLERPGKFRAPAQTSTPYNTDFVFPQSNEAIKVKLDAAQEEVMR